MKNIFGEKLRKLREARGISQMELSRRLGYASNSYLSDVEKGLFVPNEEKLRRMASSLGVGFDVLQEMALESRLDALGFREPGFVSMLKDYPRMSREDRREIVRAYVKVKRIRKYGHAGDS
ncbi:MAG: helix-turn-helix domain-containing protein [Chloroflexota bacterium]